MEVAAMKEALQLAEDERDKAKQQLNRSATRFSCDKTGPSIAIDYFFLKKKDL
jgi:hypothetical protein